MLKIKYGRMGTEAKTPARKRVVIQLRYEGSQKATRMEDGEQWLCSGSALKVELTGLGDNMELGHEKRNSRLRRRFLAKS